MINKGLVSVVCPIYNGEHFIKKTIDSVLKQTYPFFELIIIDDCSTDDTVKIIKKINDDRIKLIVNDTNSGAAFSRNKGIKSASGKYIAFLDGDDVWHSNKLEKQITFMEENNYLFSYTDYELIDANDNSLGVYYIGPKKVTFKMFLRIDYIGTSTAIYKRDIYPDLCIPNDIYKRNDDAMWLLLSKRADCYRMEGIYSKYRKTDNSISSGKKTSLFKYHVILYKKMYGYKFRAYILAMRNVFFYFLKKIRYKKRIKK